MANYNVSVTYTADGTQTVFSFPFDYLRKAFVYVELDETNTLENGVDYEVDGKTVVFFEAPTAGTIIRIYRETTTNRLVSWADASILRADDMTVQQVQELHILEETKAWVEDNAIIRDGKEWQARNFPIKDVGDPVDPKDATNKEYVDDHFMKLQESGNAWESRNLPVRNVKDPIRMQDAANKNYVDSLIAGVVAKGNNVVCVDNVAMLRATDLKAGMYAATGGYYEVNDGGASFYSIRADNNDTDDGGSIIILDNGNVAERIANIGVTNMFYVDAEGYVCQED